MRDEEPGRPMERARPPGGRGADGLSEGETVSLQVSDLSSPTPILADHLIGVAAGPDGPDAWSPRPGTRLFGRFEVIRKLGEGGMGSVWLVRRTDLDCLRALKLIVSGIADDDTSRARFRSEALLMARLSHQNAVTLHDAQLGGEGVPAYLEMEYIRGRSLDQILRPGEGVRVDWLGRLVEQLCDVIDEMHRIGAVHRDLKPSNVMLVDGRPPEKPWLKVLDFGIAKHLRSGDLTNGGLIGSLPYIAPEQILGAAEPRSDLYSIGVLLFEALTGKRPFRGSAAELIHGHLSGDPPRFAQVAPGLDIPPGLEDLIRRCLSKAPNDRPTTARELALAFAAEACSTPSASQTWTARPTPPPRVSGFESEPSAFQIGASRSESEPPAQSSKQSQRKHLAPACLMLASMGVSTWCWWSWDDGTTRPAPPVSRRSPGPVTPIEAPGRTPVSDREPASNLLAPSVDLEVFPATVDVTPSEEPAPVVVDAGAVAADPALEPANSNSQPPAIPGDPEPEAAVTVASEPVEEEPAHSSTLLASGDMRTDRLREEASSAIPDPRPIPGPSPSTPEASNPPPAVAPPAMPVVIPEPEVIPPPVPVVATVKAIDLTLLRVSKRSFRMGEHSGNSAGSPGRNVAVPSDFFLGATEVTIGQYQAVMKHAGRSVFRASSDYPSTSLTWVDAARFCNALSDLDGLPNFYAIDDGRIGTRDERVTVLGGRGYRLPTEAEWELACRSPSLMPGQWPSGFDPSDLGRFAWYKDNSGIGPDGDRRRYHEVQRRAATPPGFYDLLGNAAEWCGPSSLGPVPPMQPIRGGSFLKLAEECRMTSREVMSIHLHRTDVGLRVARDAE